MAGKEPARSPPCTDVSIKVNVQTNRIIKGHLVLIFHYHQLGTSSVPLSSFHSDPHWDVCKWRGAE